MSGKTSFKVEVPYKLIEVGEKGEKPMIVYLHGKGQNIDIFERLMKPLLDLNAYHMFIQGPYADFTTVKEKQKWGHNWYLYNGRQGSFVKSMEYTAEFIQEIVDHVLPFIKVNRLCILGYSMGGYQAGYFGTTRWKHTNEIIVIGGRIKTELLAEKWKYLKHQQILAIHAEKDEYVSAEHQAEHIKIMQKKGINATFLEVDGTHKLTSKQLKEARKWLLNIGYK